MAYKKDNELTWEEIKNFPEEWFTNHMVQATKKAIARYGLEVDENGNAIDNQADAFRHTYMQCWLAYRFGDTAAKYLGNKHEHGRNPDINPSTNMDLWNNQIGRELAQEIKREYGSGIHLADPDFLECVTMTKVRDKIINGEVITDPKNDKRKYSDMEKERLRDEDRVFYEDEYWDDMDADERLRFKEHYAKYKTRIQGKFPSKSDLQTGSLRGDYIYVNNYTRSDGTKINGYYRRRAKY